MHNNRSCPTRLTLADVNSYKTLFCLFTVSANKCGGTFTTIDY